MEWVALGLVFAGIAANFYGAWKAGEAAADQLEHAKKMRDKLDASQEKIREAIAAYYEDSFEDVPVTDENGNPVLDEDGNPVTERKIIPSKSKEYYDAMEAINTAFSDKETERITTLVESLNEASDLFGITTAELTTTYLDGIDKLVDEYQNGKWETVLDEDGNPVLDENGNPKQELVKKGANQIIQDYVANVTKQIEETTTKNLQQLNITHDEMKALTEQWYNDTVANIAVHVKESTDVNDEAKRQMDAIIAEYDAGQAGRNQKIQGLLAGASDAFKEKVAQSAETRNTIVGEWLKSTGQVLANTNEGVSEILGVTPEQNLQRAQQVATDFAVEYAETAGTAAGNQAQQAARQSGLTKGAAALMGATAATNATTDQFGQAAQTGLSAYQGAQAAQVKALEDQYARQKELAQDQIDQANRQYDDDIAAQKEGTRLAEAQAQATRDEDEGERKSTQWKLDNEKDWKEEQQRILDEGMYGKDGTGGTQGALDAKLELDRDDEKAYGDAAIKQNTEGTYGANGTGGTVGAAKEGKDDALLNLKDGYTTQQEALDKTYTEGNENARKGLETGIDIAKTTSDETKGKNEADRTNDAELANDKRQDALGLIDTNMAIANQDAGVSNNASTLAANAANKFIDQVGNTGNFTTDAGLGLADTAGMK